MSARLTISDLAPKFQAQIAAQLNAGKPIGIARADEMRKIEVVKAPKRIRQHAGDNMNRWEREYQELLKTQWEHVYREVSLPLANGVRYKVDFLCASADSTLTVSAFEVKGHARSTGIVKLKIAARLFPWIQFHLVTKRKKAHSGGWDVECVLP